MATEVEIKAVLDKHKERLNGDFQNENVNATRVISFYHLWNAGGRESEVGELLLQAVGIWQDKRGVSDGD